MALIWDGVVLRGICESREEVLQRIEEKRLKMPYALLDDEIDKYQREFNERFPDGYPEAQIRREKFGNTVVWRAENRYGNVAKLARLYKDLNTGEITFTCNR